MGFIPGTEAIVAGLFKDQIGDRLFPEPEFPDFSSQLNIPDAPPPPEETLRRLGAPEGLAARQFAQRSSIARQLGLPVSGLNIPQL